MALTFEEIQRVKWELGYNAANVGAELYVLNGYAAVFDNAIRPYLVDPSSTSSTVIAASATGGPANATIVVAANPPISGAVTNVYGLTFEVGSKLVVDVGPAQEADVVVQYVNGLALSVALQNAHGPNPYRVALQGGEYLVRDILSRLDVINAQLKGYAPVVAGMAKAGEVQWHPSSRGGRRGSTSGPADSLSAQRDLARKDLAALLGIENLWEARGKRSGGGADLSFGRY